MTYSPQDFTHLLGIKGFSDEALQAHLKLYAGYVKNTNGALEKLGKSDMDPYDKMQVRRRLGWEFNGMRLHELYFGNMSNEQTMLEDGSALTKAIERDFGSMEHWIEDFKATGAIRGIGWAVLYADQQNDGRLMNVWIDEHDGGHPAGLHPIVIMDVFEHAYVFDYGIDRGSYIDSFINAIDYSVAQERFDAVQK